VAEKTSVQEAVGDTGFTSLQRTVHVVMRLPDAEVEVAIGGA
jgi:hypothetical protein